MTPSLLTAADTVRLAAAAPIAVSKRQTGSVLFHQDFTSALLPGHGVREAQAPNIVDEDLLWPRSVRVFEAMRRDPQVQGLLMSVFMPVRHLEWHVDPAGATDETAAYIAEDLGLPLLGQRAVSDVTPGINFDDHLRAALLALAHGHRFFEESGETDAQGRYRIRWLKDYPPSSIQQIFIDSQGGLVGIRVPADNPAVDGPFKDVLTDHLVSHVWDREAADWAGRSLLVGVKDIWEDKYRLLRANTQMMTRFAGVPIATTTDPNTGAPAHDAAAAMAQAIHAGYGAGGALPFGMDMKVLGIEGSVPDIVKSCEYIDAQMARAFMQMFAELGKVGSRALGTTLLDHYTLGVMAVAKWARRTLNELVDRIVERNDGPLAARPVVAFRQNDHEDLTTADLVALIESGAIVVDDELEATIRDRANLPRRHPAEPGRQVPGTAPAVLKAAAPLTVPAAPIADQSGTDFQELQNAYEQGVAQLTAAWAPVRAAQVDELVAKVAAATTLAGVAGIAATAVTGAALLDTLTALVEHGAQSVADEAVAQGGDLPAADLATTQALLADAADATAVLLAGDLTRSAASHAVGLWGPDPDPTEIATKVREHLDGLAGATADYEFAGLATRAQNEGRFTQMEEAPDGTGFYASALNDSNSCDPCRDEDDTDFPSMAEARRDFPAGGFIGCKGMKRCRCTVVMVLPETTGQAA